MNNYNSHITFMQNVNDSNSWNISTSKNKKGKSLELLSKSLEYIPRTFTITTQSGSYRFNVEFLKDTSSIIENILSKESKDNQFHIDIKDESNVMKKFEDLYQFKVINFDISELPIIRKISEALNLVNCPVFMQPERLQQSYYSVPIKPSVSIEKNSLCNFLQRKITDQFTIIANGQEYKCNSLGVNSSKIIQKLREEDPNLNKYVYNFENEEEDESIFNIFVNLFNFQTIEITINNMSILHRIAEDLQIESILNDINEFINSYENTVQLIDDQKIIIDSIEDIFDWLYHIEDITVDEVANKIIASEWVDSEDDIKELAACILQVVRTNYFLQPFIIDLLLSLDISANDQNHLKILIPYIVQQLLIFLSMSNLYCAFIYKLYKKGIVSMEVIVNKICNTDIYISRHLKQKRNETNYENFGPTNHYNLISWFYPEIVEIKKISLEMLSKDSQFDLSIYRNIDNFKKMRDSGEPDDDITKAILHDDVEKFQTIISNNKIDINLARIPRNMFEVFEYQTMNATYINYAAEYGAIKCFKYLFLNHASIDKSTLLFAVYGGNAEIIRILDQNKSNYSKMNNQIMMGCNYAQSFYNISLLDGNFDPLIPAIIKHQYDLFDWLLELEIPKNNVDMQNLIFYSILSGNTHSLIGLIDKGIDLSLLFDISNFNTLFSSAAKQGFYRYMQLLLIFLENNSISKNNINKMGQSIMDASVNVGNLSIFKLYMKTKDLNGSCDQPLQIAIHRDYEDIIKYIIENIYHPNSTISIVNIFTKAISKKTAKLFNYIESKFKLNDLLITNCISLSSLIYILSEGCYANNIEIVKTITDLILVNDSNANFSFPFLTASKAKSEEICQYFIDKKVSLNVSKLARHPAVITLGNGRISLNLISNLTNSKIKNLYLQWFLNEAIKSGNISFAELLLNKIPPTNENLFSAIRSHDLNIVNLVLKYNSKPSFINQVDNVGTVLNVAVFHGDIDIVKRLLSIPGINPNLYDRNNVTPIMSAISRFNINILEVLLDFYGDDIQNNLWQLESGLKKILFRLSNISSTSKKRRSRLQSINSSYNDSQSSFLEENKEEISTVINRLIRIENINLNCSIRDYTLLTYACEANDMELLKFLLESGKVDVNSYAPLDGNTPLMVAIDKKNIEIAETLIKYPTTDINHKNYKNNTALTFAVINNLENVITLLINSPKFDPVESRLDYAFFISNGSASKQLYLAKSLDVNYNSYRENDPIDQENNNRHNRNNNNREENIRIYSFESTLIRAINQRKNEMVDMIINHPSFDPNESQVKTAIFVTIKNEQEEIFEKLLKLVDKDINIHNDRNHSLLYYAILLNKINLVEKILEDESFDPSKSDILGAFIKASCLNENDSNEVYGRYNVHRMHNNIEKSAKIDIMNDLVEYDENHSHLINFDDLLPNGKSFFTSICIYINNLEELVQFFLEHNVDPNLPDKFGVYPLEYAIRKNSISFCTTLLNSDRIDLSIRMNKRPEIGNLNETYLHLAAKNDTFNLILSQNVIDVNAVDDLGETVLMKACQTGKKNNVISLFSIDTLDYLHRNKKGEDALEIAKKSINVNQFGTGFSNNPFRNQLEDNMPKEKVDYLYKLLPYLKF